MNNNRPVVVEIHASLEATHYITINIRHLYLIIKTRASVCLGVITALKKWVEKMMAQVWDFFSFFLEKSQAD